MKTKTEIKQKPETLIRFKNKTELYVLEFELKILIAETKLRKLNLIYTVVGMF